jgi:hypothetical protein
MIPFLCQALDLAGAVASSSAGWANYSLDSVAMLDLAGTPR